MKKIMDILKSTSFLGFILIVFLIYSRTVFPSNKFEKIDVPDLKVYYGSEKLYSMLEKMENKQLTDYKSYLISLDIVYPIIYGLLFISLLLTLGNRIKINQRKLKLILIIPLISIIFDILENLTNYHIISQLPDRVSISSISGFFTLIKWVSIFVSILFILSYSIRLLLEKIKESSINQ